MKIPFCGEAYTDKTLNANAQRCVNLYPVLSPAADDPQRVVLYPVGGYDSIGVSGYVGEVVPPRGTFELNGLVYEVRGNKAYKVAISWNANGQGTGTATQIGTLTTSTGRVFIECNTVQVVFSDGTSVYTYDLETGTFAAVTDTDLADLAPNGLTNITYQDGYILGAVRGSNRVVQFDLRDATSIDPLAFRDILSFADELKAIFSDRNNLYCFSKSECEVLYNAGSIPFAFSKISNVLIQAGCAAVASIAKIGSTIMWLASDPGGRAYVAAMEGFTPKPMSTQPINDAIESYGDVSDAYAYVYRQGGSLMYQITFPSVGKTWVCETSTGWWHERQYDRGADIGYSCVNLNNRNIVQAQTDNGAFLFELSQSAPLDDRQPRIRVSPHLTKDGKIMFLDELNIMIEQGLHNNDPVENVYGFTPKATLRISRDYGHTWVSVGTADLGRLGEYRKRLTWRRLAGGRQITLELTITDEFRTYILGADAKIRLGAK